MSPSLKHEEATKRSGLAEWDAAENCESSFPDFHRACRHTSLHPADTADISSDTQRRVFLFVLHSTVVLL